MKGKKIIFTLLLLLCMSSIFYFSHQEGEESNKTSNGFIMKVINGVEKSFHLSIEKEKKEEIVENSRFIIRKCAHFTIYLILGLCMYVTLDSYSFKKLILYSILFCFLYACSDEIHQFFIKGRSAKLIDVGIDTFGSSLGIFIINWLKKNLKK